MSQSSVLVIGAGPAGLAVAACLAGKRIDYVLVDRTGQTGGAYARIYAHTQLASPVRYNHLPGRAVESREEYMNVARYADYLRGYAVHYRLQPQMSEVAHVERAQGGFCVRFANSDREATFRFVIVATGMFDFPHWPMIPGLVPGATVMHVAHWQGPGIAKAGRVLIIGGATSAVEIAEECARAGIRSIVSVRERTVKLWPQRVLGRDIHDYVRWFESLPRSFMRRYCAGKQTLPGTDRGFANFRRAGLIDVRGPAAHIEGRTAVFVDGRREDFDAIVCATGYRHDTPFLCAEARAADNCESRAWPGLFLLGLPCARKLNSAFLRGIATDAQAVARRIASVHA